ncbi:hypothetical protein GCM10017044_28130 [Kordiimonas sediminis]|uniref:MPN domain-containing protein n=1 Tax=Kordiimonas sediminis TaxID=1735581 RepID=A0A919EBD2_9PROT|nr:DNA repair protein RadC [Kordiimonas sediminis]GHF31074.1 hypothetical protein GCM10017044_28130 [Kordiimonas sediminis]
MGGTAIDNKKNAVSHGAGHRQRLRNRFLKGGLDSVADYEVLEMLLFTAIPRRDVKPLAKQLIQAFGSLGGVLTADVTALRKMDGLGDAAIGAIKTVQAAAVLLAKSEMMDRPVVSNWKALLDYVRTRLVHEKREQFRVLFLDRKNTILADEKLGEGTVDHTPVYPREIVRRALELHASALILVHNHPSGDPSPSKADIAMTREVAEACKKLDIMVHDHVIVGRYGHTSFKSKGLL